MNEAAPASERRVEYGNNVTVHGLFFRHALKANAQIAKPESGSTQVSSAAIAPEGESRSRNLGRALRPHVPRGRHGMKLYHSDQARTLETGRAMKGGARYHLADWDAKKPDKYKDQKTIALSLDFPEGFLPLYTKLFEENKARLMQKKGIRKDFSELPPEEQAAIAEPAEEPIIRDWLEKSDSELARLYPPEEAAAKLAVRVSWILAMPARLRSGSQVELLHVTHKTITEPLLMRILVLDSGQRPERLADIGGSLGLNDGWGIEVRRDQKGRRKVRLCIYRAQDTVNGSHYEKKKYKINLAELERLAHLGMLAKKENVAEKAA